MDVFNYAEHFVHRIAVAHDPKSLIQIELHPGLHCDLYRCPHCYGHGQHIMPGEVLSAAEIDAALADVAASAPTIIVSGIATEPLTHPDAVGILQAIKRQRLPLGLYTKGLNLVPQVRQSLLDGESETFVTVSLDAVSGADYMIKHNIAAGPKDEGRNYHERVLDNLRQFRIERDRVGARVEIRAAFLLFSDTAAEGTIEHALETVGPHVDLLRFSFPQVRNDGAPPGPLPPARPEVLRRLAARFEDQPKVKVLTSTGTDRQRDAFSRCHVQRFQVTIDKVGNVFPCPQVALANFQHLSFGNIRTHRLGALLESQGRLALFDADVDSAMSCRICDRKDYAVNVALDRLSSTFDAPGAIREGIA